MKQFLTLVLLMLIGSLPIKAQHVVKGIVVDKEGTPLPGVTVVVRGKEAGGTITTIDGKYALNFTPDGETIQERPYDYQVVTIAGVFPNLICAGRDDCVRFLKDIFDEVCDLFPGPEVHIGGDEAIKQHWRRCPDCQRRMREEGLKDEHELQR